jgi:hypothetical protein
VTIFDQKGTLVRSVASDDPSAFLVDGPGRVVTARGALLLPEKAAPISFLVPTPGRAPRAVEEIPSMIAMASGDWLIADRKAKTVVRISADGKFLSNFATVNAERLARNDFDDVAMIDRDSKSVIIADRDGRTIGRLAAKGQGYQFEDPADLAFDALGHLYVLDSRRAAIHVFAPNQRLVTTITSAGRQPGSLQRPRAMAIDSAGRLYVFDDSSQRIQVYQ